MSRTEDDNVEQTPPRKTRSKMRKNKVAPPTLDDDDMYVEGTPRADIGDVPSTMAPIRSTRYAFAKNLNSVLPDHKPPTTNVFYSKMKFSNVKWYVYL